MIINEMPIIMVKCLLITVIIEVIVGIILKVKEKKDFLNIILVNFMTNPIVVTFPVYINIRFGLLERNFAVLILEILTVIIEGTIYKKYLKYDKINPYIMSLILNLSSYIIGDIIKYI